MTRASLLHILDHVGSISEAENQELVQLATAFPYCQTAHLLLAKAAHDKGSMLAGQRLRRAATYAADRELLRLLIEQPDVLLPAPVTVPPLPAAAPSGEASPAAERGVESAVVEDTLTTSSKDSSKNAAVPENSTTTQDTTEALAAVDAPLVPILLPADAKEVKLLPEAEVVQEATVEGPEAPLETATTASEAEALILAGADDLLPAAAPPIRPPADAGSSRFEFGLTNMLPPTPAAYELLDEVPTALVPAAAGTVASPAFYTDPTIGYGLDLGSRLGTSLQSRGDYTTDLPPTEFFPPDALLLAHIEAHQPTLPAPQKTLAIIDQFLKNQPRLKAPAVVSPAEEQADLSVSSTSATTALASESLATIMVKQGKTAKAIEIYERLMVRQPEKKAYFADQIAQLKSAE